MAPTISQHFRDICRLMDRMFKENHLQIHSLANTIKSEFILTLLEKRFDASLYEAALKMVDKIYYCEAKSHIIYLQKHNVI